MVNVQAVGDASPSNVMQSCMLSSPDGAACLARRNRPGSRRPRGESNPTRRRDEAAVRQLADPDREIDMLLHEVDHAVGQHDPDVDLRIGLEELRAIGTTCRRPKTIGAVITSSPLGALYSPDAARSASPTSSRMRLHAAT